MATDNTSRVLVTTALESSWPGVDTPVVFLGEWCRLYERRSHWTRYDGEVARYHWDDRQRLRRDFEHLQLLNESLLVRLVDRLNEVHSVHRSLAYWRMLIGCWLNLFTAVLFDRWTSLHEAIGAWDIRQSTDLGVPVSSVVALDTSHFNDLVANDVWNHAIYSRLLRGWTGVPVVVGDRQGTPEVELGLRQGQTGRERLIGALAAISSRWSKPGDGLLYATALPLADELRLQLRLGQWPRLCLSRPSPEAVVNPSMRAWTLTPKDPEDTFEKIACCLIAHQLPRVYLEGYRDLVSAAGDLTWPDEPAFVWTSYAHITDDVFKVWAAEKSEAGSPLVIGQHGGTAQALFNGQREHGNRIADHRLTFGPAGAWAKGSTSVGIWKALPKVRKRRTGAVLVTEIFPRFSHDLRSMIIAGQVLPYFEDQFRFVAALSPVVRADLTVRMSRVDYGWAQSLRWKDRFPDIRLDDGRIPIFDLMRKTRLCISSYNSTSYFESISVDLPTVTYWNPQHWEVDPAAESYMDAFSRAGIFHDTPESAAWHVSHIWEDVESWWAGDAVRGAVDLFKRGFCQSPVNRLADLKTALRTHVKVL